jgi:hypothetical protein
VFQSCSRLGSGHFHDANDGIQNSNSKANVGIWPLPQDCSGWHPGAFVTNDVRPGVISRGSRVRTARLRLTATVLLLQPWAPPMLKGQDSSCSPDAVPADPSLYCLPLLSTEAAPLAKKAAWMALVAAATGAARQLARDYVNPPTEEPA